MFATGVVDGKRDAVPAVVGVLMGVQAASLAVMSFLHLHGDLRDGALPFRSGEAGVAEAVICAVLLGAVVAMWRLPRHARPIALAAVGFAIAGFLVGITITISGGATVDIVYHSTVLPVLVATMVLAARRPGRPTST
jgi:hypothetical protein